MAELDLGFAVDREEKAGVHAYENLAPAVVGHENSESPYDKRSFVPAEPDHDDCKSTEIDQQNTLSLSKYSHYRGEMDELRGNYFDKSSIQFEEQSFPSKSRTEDPAHSQESPLTPDANLLEEMEGNSDFDKPTTYQVSDRKDGAYYDSRDSLSESQEYPPSPVSKRSPSLVTAKQMSVARKCSPSVHQSPNGHKRLSSRRGVRDPSNSQISHREEHPSPERSDLAKGAAVRDCISPSRQTSMSPRRSQHKEGSRKRRSASPKVYKGHRTHKRSVSRSPVHKRDSSSGYKRDSYGRSRSRSAHARDRHRSPRRRHSPRRRSPRGYHSRHHSPRPRPWSPPPNRRTGLGKPGKNLFVAGFSFLTTERDLERKFSRFGRVRDVRIVRDRRSGDSRGFGFLSLERDEDADAAIRALDETEWNGRIILVEKSKSA